MNWNWLSFTALAGLVVCIWGLFLNHYSIFGAGPITITIQVLAALLMVWARLTFGIRSFHGTANPTAGGLITTGPYRYLRHPIYAAILYFLWAGIAAHPSLGTVAIGLLATAFTTCGSWRKRSCSLRCILSTWRMRVEQSGWFPLSYSQPRREQDCIKNLS